MTITVGAKIGDLTVLAPAEPYIRRNGKSAKQWLCECACGTKYVVHQSNLSRPSPNGWRKCCESCSNKRKAARNPSAFKKGQRAHNADSLLGQKFGLWTVIEGPFPVELKNGKKHLQWLLKCACGTTQRMWSGWIKRSGGCIPCTRKRGEEHGNYSGGALKSEWEKMRHAAMNGKKRVLACEISYLDFERLVLMQCQYCGRAPSFTVRRAVFRNTLDRVDSSEGYTLQNVVPACWPCNRTKGPMGKDEFIELAKRIAAFQASVGFRDSETLLRQPRTTDDSQG